MFKGDCRYSAKLPSMHDSDEEWLTDYIANATRWEIEQVVYETRIFQENITKETFDIAYVKRGKRKSTHYKHVCLINEVNEYEVVVTIQSLTYSNDRTDIVYKEDEIFALDIMVTVDVLPFPETT